MEKTNAVQGRGKAALLLVLSALAAVLVLVVPGTAWAVTRSEVEHELEQIRERDEGTYWTTDGRPSDSNGSTSKSFYGIQCKGYASMVFAELFDNGYIGSYSSDKSYIPSPNGAEAIYCTVAGTLYIDDEDAVSEAFSRAAPGDFVQMRRRDKSYGHSQIVYSVDGGGVTFLDCNADGHCLIQVYRQTWTTFCAKNSGFSIYRADGYDSTSVPSSPLPPTNNNHNPVGSFDLVLSGPGSVCVAGWAIDPDDEAAQLNLHVYVGGAPGQPGVEGYWIAADMYRNDVGAHSFHSWISVGKEGTQEVYVYAINVGEGSNTFLGSKTVDIPSGNPVGCLDSIEGDYGKIRVRGWAFDPSDSNASLSIHVYIGGAAGSGEGHAIVANQLREDVNAAYGISGKHGFDTLIETEKRGSQDVYVYALNIGSGTDHACIGRGSASIMSDTTPPTISNVRLQDVSAEGYTISCKVTDNVGVKRVTFPTWTVANGQDDLLSGREFDDGYVGMSDGDTWTFRVKVSDHGGERGKYLTHIYAWDAVGNRAKLGDEGTTVVEVPAKTATLTSEANQHEDGWVDLDSGKGYARGGKLVTGWMDLGSSKYWFHPDGAMATGWTDVTDASGKTFRYYFNPASGNLVRNTWFDIDGTKYYFRPSGNLATGWATISDGGVDKKYYFDPDGRLVTGWADIDNGQGQVNHYYFRPSGSMATGWATIDGQKYWFRDSGNMATGFTTVSDGSKRYFDAEGHMLVGWQVIGGKTFYFRDPSGAMQTGEMTLDGVTYVFTASGTLSSVTVSAQSEGEDEGLVVAQAVLDAVEDGSATLQVFEPDADEDASPRVGVPGMDGLQDADEDVVELGSDEDVEVVG